MRGRLAIRCTDFLLAADDEAVLIPARDLNPATQVLEDKGSAGQVVVRPLDGEIVSVLKKLESRNRHKIEPALLVMGPAGRANENQQQGCENRSGSQAAR